MKHPACENVSLLDPVDSLMMVTRSNLFLIHNNLYVLLKMPEMNQSARRFPILNPIEQSGSKGSSSRRA